MKELIKRIKSAKNKKAELEEELINVVRLEAELKKTLIDKMKLEVSSVCIADRVISIRSNNKSFNYLEVDGEYVPMKLGADNDTLQDKITHKINERGDADE